MNTETKIEYLQKKIDYVSQLRNNERDDDSIEFKKWKESVNSALLRISKLHHLKFAKVHFSSQISVGGYQDKIWDHEAYLRGLDSSVAILEAAIEDLKVWGPGEDNLALKGKKPAREDYSTTINLVITQNQSQQIINDIDLNQYPVDVQKEVKELLDELKKNKKDKKKIRRILIWLADKSVDALIAIILNRINDPS